MSKRPTVGQLTLVFLFVTSIATSLAFAQEKWALKNKNYYEPLIAEPRAATVNILFLGLSDEFPFSQERGRRRVWDISLGKEIPIVGYHSGGDPKEPLTSGKWGWGIWIPVSFHMIEDFKDESNPILNTDYRFSGMIKAQRGLNDKSRLGGRFQFGHESTHLGDEFSLAARRTRPDFERINVSYEYWEYGFSFETDREKDELTFRHGGIGLFRPNKGFYSAEVLEPEGRIIPRSKRNFEPSFGFEWISKRKMFKGAGFFLSTDLRHKTVYDYNKQDSDSSEEKQLSTNLLFGLRRVDRQYLEKGLPNFYFRFYHGVNPNGQFRSQRDYTLIGIGMQIPL